MSTGGRARRWPSLSFVLIAVWLVLLGWAVRKDEGPTSEWLVRHCFAFPSGYLPETAELSLGGAGLDARGIEFILALVLNAMIGVAFVWLVCTGVPVVWRSVRRHRFRESPAADDRTS